jgi:hypothetical protein
MKKPLRKVGKWILGVTKNPTIQAMVINFLRSKYMN